MITVLGATGNTGRKIAEVLLEAGEKVRAVARTESKLKELKRSGAEVSPGDMTDPDFLTKALRGSDAVYTLLPTDPKSPDYRAAQDKQGHAIARAIRDSGVRYVVALSSLGADLDEGTGLILGLHAQEERLKELKKINILFLRPASFFENFYQQRPGIENEGIIGDTIAPDFAMPMVATRDIASAAAKALAARDWTGVMVRELLGERDLTHAEAALILGERLGKPKLAYVQLSSEDMAGIFAQMGFSQSFAHLYGEMTRAFHDRIRPRSGRNAANTTPTRFEDFAEEFAQAYQTA